MQRTGLVLTFVCTCFAQTAFACPAGTQTVLSCSAKGGAKALDICLDPANATVSYAYGARNRQPELFLTRRIEHIEHQPWPGVGRSIWESTVFHNKGYAYEVFISVDRMVENQPPTGGVILHQGAKQIARVDCDTGTAEVGLWAVSDAKEAVGLCWDQGAHIWNNCTQ